jgi:DNA mismatch repair ATPase MutS
MWRLRRFYDRALQRIRGNWARGPRNCATAGGDDPMDFDYRLKQGMTDETNALAIARMAGVPV